MQAGLGSLRSAVHSLPGALFSASNAASTARNSTTTGCASFRDWATQGQDHPREVVEAALPNVVQNKVKAAYARSDLFKPRRLMDEWSVYLAGERVRTG